MVQKTQFILMCGKTPNYYKDTSRAFWKAPTRALTCTDSLQPTASLFSMLAMAMTRLTINSLGKLTGRKTPN